jgi:O-antigen/teichoic acid export membrane protein
LGEEESAAVRHRLMHGAAGFVALRLAFSALSFVVTLLLARLLGAEGFGAYSWAFAWVVLLGVPAILGTDQLLVREIAACQTRGEWGRVRGILRRSQSAVLLASCGIALIAASAAWLLRLHLPARVLPTCMLALPLLPLIALTRVRQAAMQGMHRVALGTLPEQLIQPGCFLAFLLAAAFWRAHGLTPPVAMTLNAGASLIAFCVGAWLMRRAMPPLLRESEPVYDNTAWKRSALRLLFVAGANILFAQADTLILGAMRGNIAVGTYTVAHKGADLIMFPLMALNAAFASTTASLYATGDLARLQRLVTRLSRWTLLCAAPIGLFMILFGDRYLALYGPQFPAARLALAILSFGQIVNVGMGCVGLLLIMAGHENEAAKAVGIAAFVNIALTAALSPRWGSEGAAVAYAIGMILWNVLMVASLSRKVGIHSTAMGKLTVS